MARFLGLVLGSAFIFSTLGAQQPPPKESAPAEQAPPEEDESLQPPKNYAFNPLQAEREVRVGNFYFKKGSYKAAAGRYREALKWNPMLADAYLKLGEAEEKLNDAKGAREAYLRFIEMAPGNKQVPEVKKRLAALPPEPPKTSQNRSKPKPGQADKPR